MSPSKRKFDVAKAGLDGYTHIDLYLPLDHGPLELSNLDICRLTFDDHSVCWLAVHVDHNADQAAQNGH